MYSFKIRAIRLMVFVTFLAPAWYYGLKYYLGSPDVIRNIKYGPNARNYLDVCLPPNESKKKRPVVSSYSYFFLE